MLSVSGLIVIHFKTNTMPFTIRTLTAFVATDQDGEEGVMAALNQDDGTWVPLVCADESRVESMYPIAVSISETMNVPFRVMQFSQREDITDEVAAKYASKEPT